MFNSIDTFEKIWKEYRCTDSIDKRLDSYQSYNAHTSKLGVKNDETLDEHLELVESYFLQIVSNEDFDSIVNKMICKYLSEISRPSKELALVLKRLFAYTIFYHDHGKINENFQVEKMKNARFSPVQSIIGSKHSTLSSFVFLNHSINRIFDNSQLTSTERNIATSVSILLSYSIYKHHSNFNDDVLESIVVECKKAPHLEEYLSLFDNSDRIPQITKQLADLEPVLDRIQFHKYRKSFSLYQLLKLNYSLLTASDYLATNEYMNGHSIDNWGQLSNARIAELYTRVTKSEWLEDKLQNNYNKKTYDELDTISYEKPTDKSNTNLNVLRQQMASEAILNLRNNIDQNVFYLEAPTGGGKTNISLMLSIELLKAHKQLNKVFYVFPYTTLIDQTFKSIKKTLSLEDSEIVALHSKAPMHHVGDSDDIYGDQRRNYIHNLFNHFPFCLLSHIRFFDVLKTPYKEKNYLLHRMANSIVVIDELQSYPPKHWDKIVYFIQNYADTYGMKFILMSATLPKIGNLNIKGVDTSNIVYLLPNAKTDYFQNTNFKERVDFDFTLLENKTLTFEDLSRRVLEESKKYSNKNSPSKPLDSVYTIIEFIFKKSATRFNTAIQSIHNDFFDEILLLSGTILPHRRQSIINRLKNTDYRSKKILVITTQVVEAGVDIDMDIGFKDTSLVDSDEQLAGRINRNVNKNDCTLFLFNMNKEAIIYGDDLRYKMTKKMDVNFHREILETKNFDKLYEKVIQIKNTVNSNQDFVGIEDYINHVHSQRFKSVDEEFKLIVQDNISCFIPLEVPTHITGIHDEEVMVFTIQELDYLNKMGVNTEATISGEAIFDLYVSIIENNQSFIDKKIELKQIQPILSRFVISMYASKKLKTALVQFSDAEKSNYGYYYLSHWNQIYDEFTGLDESNFDEIETQFL